MLKSVQRVKLILCERAINKYDSKLVPLCRSITMLHGFGYGCRVGVCLEVRLVLSRNPKTWELSLKGSKSWVQVCEHIQLVAT